MTHGFEKQRCFEHSPRFWFAAQNLIFYWIIFFFQRRNISIYARHVAFQNFVRCLVFFPSICCIFSRPKHTVTTLVHIRFECFRVRNDFRQTPRSFACRNIHLKQTVLCVQITLHKNGIVYVFCKNMRYFAVVKFDFNACSQTANLTTFEVKRSR